MEIQANLFSLVTVVTMLYTNDIQLSLCTVSVYSVTLLDTNAQRSETGEQIHKTQSRK